MNNIKIKQIKKNTEVTKNWVKWLNDKDVTKFSKNRFKKHTLKTQKKFLLSKLKLKNNLIFKIFIKKKHIGIIEISKINNLKKFCYISYMIGEKKYWNKGIGTEAIGLIKKYIFDKLNFTKIFAGIYSNNKGSMFVLKKNNFKVYQRKPKFFKYNNIKVDKIVLIFKRASQTSDLGKYS
tara:strand:- start:54947 stop:55483 length:537 start_codon:yes stop_codon:yes gene_type:complete